MKKLLCLTGLILAMPAMAEKDCTAAQWAAADDACSVYGMGAAKSCTVATNRQIYATCHKSDSNEAFAVPDTFLLEEAPQDMESDLGSEKRTQP